MGVLWLFVFLIKITSLFLALENATWDFLQICHVFIISCLLVMLTEKSCCSCCSTSSKIAKQEKNREDWVNKFFLFSAFSFLMLNLLPLFNHAHYTVLVLDNSLSFKSCLAVTKKEFLGRGKKEYWWRYLQFSWWLSCL